jgi:hypothetical protein
MSVQATALPFLISPLSSIIIDREIVTDWLYLATWPIDLMYQAVTSLLIL